MGKLSEFIEEQSLDYDIILVRGLYIDMLDGDVTAAALLGQIVYWHLPAKKGGKNSKLGVWKNHPETGKRTLWLAKSMREWYDETRITPARARRSIAVLKVKGIIETHTWRWNGSNTTHMRLLSDEFMRQYGMAKENRLEQMKSEVEKDTHEKASNEEPSNEIIPSSKEESQVEEPSNEEPRWFSEEESEVEEAKKRANKLSGID
jgi:hypothetical protein